MSERKRLTPELARAHIEANSVPEPNTGCWLWLGASSGHMKYGRAYLAGRSHHAHRLAYLGSGRTIPAGQMVLHKCDQPPCVNPDHLIAGTHADNMRDRAERQRTSSGEQWRAANRRIRRGSECYGAKLTEKDIPAIRAALAANEPKASIARRHGVTRALICQIATGKRWRGQ